MTRSLVWLACASAAVVGALGEQQLRSQPSIHASLAADVVSVLERAGLEKSLSHAEAVPDEDDKRRQKEEKEAVSDFKAFGLMNSGEIFLSFLIWLVLYGLLACYYHKCVLFYAPLDETTGDDTKREHYRDFQEWRSGLFGCAEYPGITFWACCCPAIRWADTMSKVGFHTFYKAFAIMTLLWSLMFIPIASGLCFLVVVCYMTYTRQALRKTFEFEEHGGASWASDCLTMLCCMCCAVAQEARQTREACTIGHPAITPPTPREDEETA